MANPTPSVARLPLDALTPHPRNVREGDVGAIAESLRAFGQYRPIVVQADATNETAAPLRILAGSHTWRAHVALRDQAIAEGRPEDAARWSLIDVYPIEVDEDTALRIMLADNRTAELGRNDDGALARLLEELANNGSLTGTAYSRDDVDELLRVTGLLGADRTNFLSGYDDKPDTGDELDPGEYVTVAFTMLPSERATVMSAVRESQRRNGAETQPAALIALCTEYLQTTP